MRSYACAVACLLLAALGVAACGDDGTSGGAAQGAAKKPRVYVLYPTVEDQASVDGYAGAKSIAKKMPNVAFTFDAGNSFQGASDMIRRLESAITQQYDVIAFLPGAVANEITPTLKKADKAGIKLVAGGGEGTGFERLLAANIELDYVQNGKLMGDFAKEQLPEGGKAGVIDCFTEVPQVKAINDGIRKALTGSGVSIVAHLDSKCDPAKSRSAAENMLTANPDLKAIFAIWDVSALGALKAVKGRDLLLIGGGGQKDAAKIIQADNTPLKASTNTHFYDSGARLAEVAGKVALGESPPKIIRTPSTLITKDTAADVLSGPAG